MDADATSTRHRVRRKGGNVRYVIVFALFSFGRVVTAAVFPDGVNIPLSILVVMALMMKEG